MVLLTRHGRLWQHRQHVAASNQRYIGLASSLMSIAAQQSMAGIYAADQRAERHSHYLRLTRCLRMPNRMSVLRLRSWASSKITTEYLRSSGSPRHSRSSMPSAHHTTQPPLLCTTRISLL